MSFFDGYIFTLRDFEIYRQVNESCESMHSCQFKHNNNKIINNNSINYLNLTHDKVA